jgi:hypothetical protein
MTTRLQDLTFKLKYFGGLHDAVDKANRLDKYQNAQNVMRMLGISDSNMLDDDFKKKVDEYREEVTRGIKLLVTNYDAFKTYAEAERKKARETRNIKIEDIDSAIKTVEDARSSSDAHDVNDPIPGKENRPYDGENQYGMRLRAPPPSSSKTYGGEFKIKLLEVKRKCTDILKHKLVDAPNLIDELRATISRLDGMITSNHTGQRISSFMNPLTEILQQLEIAKVTISRQGETLDINLISIDDYLKYIDLRPQPQWMVDESFSMDPKSDPYKNGLTIDAMYAKLGQPLRNLLDEGGKEIDKMLSSIPREDETRKNDLNTIKTMISKLGVGLMLAPMTGKKAPEIDELARMLQEKTAIVTSGDKMNFKKTSGRTLTTFGMSGDDQQSPESSMAGFLYRRLDKKRIVMYGMQLEHFKKSVDDVSLDDRVRNHRVRMDAKVAEIEAQLGAAMTTDDPTQNDSLKQSMQIAKARAIQVYAKAVKRTVAEFVKSHVSFVMKRHRDAIEFMNYWEAMGKVEGLVDDGSNEGIKKYMALRKDIVAETRVKLVNNVRAEIRSALSEPPEKSPTRIVLTDAQEVEVQEVFTELLVWVSEQADRVDRLYTMGAPSTLDYILDPQFIVIYALKLLRFFIAWYALRVASKLFQRMYEGRVYARDEQPPHPITFIGMFLGIDLAVNLIVGMVLIFAKRLFKSVDNGFPIDGQLLLVWAGDYAITTAAVFVLVFIIGQIIRKKKYFRYKYEGDRGIRALQEMAMRVYMIMLFIPFFRLFNG